MNNVNINKQYELRFQQVRMVLNIVLLVTALIFIGIAGCSPTKELPSANILLTAEDIYWDKNIIQLRAGQEISLKIVNNGILHHTFEIPELGINIKLPTGVTKETTFYMPEPGIYAFVCNVPGHAEAGMLGTIVVSD